MNIKPFPEEEGIRHRYLFEFERLKTEHKITAQQFAHRMGFKSGSFLSDLQKGRYLINLQYLMATFWAFPDFRLMWVLTDPSIPEIKITNLQGTRGKGVAGRKPSKQPTIRRSGPTTKREEKRIKSYWDTI